MKYFKPKSLTFWAAVFPLVMGLIIAIGPIFPSMAPIVDAAIALTGGTSASVLINAGLGGIGLRGALG
jgi:hypothetical protein